jgi:hypothetical protein
MSTSTGSSGIQPASHPAAEGQSDLGEHRRQRGRRWSEQSLDELKAHKASD